MAKFLDGTGLADLLNKIKNAFVAKADTTAVTGVGVDSTPTASSTNLVTSGGVYQALQGAGAVQDVTVDGTSVVANKVAVIPAIPTVVAMTNAEIDTIVNNSW